jgi:aspartate aminotransferase-like enzyme
MRRFYWDLARAKSFLEKSQTPWTPAVSTFYALDSALGVMEEEGLSHILARHARVGRAAREGIKSLGLSLFADEAFASNTVTAIKAPDGLDVNMLRRVLREEHQVIVAGGQQKLAGKIFRIGHMGWVDEEDIEEIMKALKEALPKAGFMS